MRVLIINVRIGSGSVGKIVVDLYNDLKRDGHECKIAYARGGIASVPENDTIKISNMIDMGLHFLASTLFGKTATYSRIETKKFLKKVDYFHPDVVHIHGIYGYYINMEVLFDYLRERKIPLVTTMHSCWDYTGHCCYFSYAGCDQWKDGCRNCPQKNTYPKAIICEDVKLNYALKKRLYNSLDKCVVVSPCEWMNDNVSNSFLSNLNTKVINNGIDLSKFKPNHDISYIDSLHLNPQNVHILAIANTWDARKGFNDVIELSKRLKENCKIILIGKITKQQKSMLNDKILYISRTEKFDELVALYSFADILFNPTYDDNYPTVLLEAIACHTAIATYDTGGCSEIIRYNRFGICVEKKNYDSVIQYAIDIHTGEKRIDYDDLSHIDKHNMTGQYIELYHELCHCVKE